VTHSAEDFMQEANKLLEAKSFSAASLALCRALDLNPHILNAHYILGVLLLQGGQAVVSLPCLMTADMLQPNNPQFVIAFSRALLDMGERPRAASNLAFSQKNNPANAALNQAIAQCPVTANDAPLHEGYISPLVKPELDRLMTQAKGAFEAGDHKQAYLLASELVWAVPQSALVWRMLGKVAGANTSPIHGEMCTRRAIAIAPKEAQSWIDLSRIVREAPDRQADCERILRRALEVCGPDEAICAALCELLFKTNRYREAIELIDTVSGTRPEPSVKLMRLQIEALQHQGKTDQAAAILDRALDFAPANHELLADAFKFYEARVDPAPMLALLKRAKTAGVELGQGVESDVMARVAVRAGELDDAFTHISRSLEGAAEEAQIMSRRYTLASIEDKRGNYRPAFEAAIAANEMMETHWEQDGPCDHTMSTRRLDSLQNRLEAEIKSGKSRCDDRTAGPTNIAFLVGFPRSGTTLLDSILRSHSRVSIVEEEPVLIRALREAVPGMSGDETNFTEDWLDRLQACDPMVLREKYLNSFSQYADEDLASDRIYIDKLPLNMNWAPLLHEIFPQAVFILAGRNPLDVAISNLFQDYQPNNAMLNMTSLRRISTLYDKSFAFWECFEAWRKPNCVSVSYEDIIADLEGSVTPVMEKLGLKWEKSQARFFETAQKRGRINTPSASQVTRKLYKTSRERWRHYDEFMQGSEAHELRQWAEKQGYLLAGDSEGG
jgi:tetratricopeptide (TPR) repeat protein